MRVGWKAAAHNPKIASFRFRALMPISALKARGHDVRLFELHERSSYDTVLFSKSYREPDRQIARSLKSEGKRVVLDLCDNHFYNPYNLSTYRTARQELLEMIGLSDQLICSTPALAEVVRAETGTKKPISVIGDAAEFLEVPSPSESSKASLLWFGSHGSPNAPAGMNDLLAIEPQLRKVYERSPFELVIASNNRSKFEDLVRFFKIPLRYEEWSIENFPVLLAEARAVIIPLSKNPFVACKTHNRVTTALAAGVPVVADTIDSYQEFSEFCFFGDWETGLTAALDQPNVARRRAAPAKAYLKKNWTMEHLAPKWEGALGLSGEELVSKRPRQQIVDKTNGGPAVPTASVTASASTTTTQKLDAAQSLEISSRPDPLAQRTIQITGRHEKAIKLQKKLVGEFEQLNLALENVRKIAARIVIIAGREEEKAETVSRTSVPQAVPIAIERSHPDD